MMRMAQGRIVRRARNSYGVLAGFWDGRGEEEKEAEGDIRRCV
jgi:hypothetical protein